MTRAEKIAQEKRTRELKACASAALLRDKQIKALTAEQEIAKAWLRDAAGGQSLTEDVPGFGSVKVASPSLGGVVSTSTSTVLDLEKFKALPVDKQVELARLGVVVDRVTTSTSKPSAAAVSFVHNK